MNNLKWVRRLSVFYMVMVTTLGYLGLHGAVRAQKTSGPQDAPRRALVQDVSSEHAGHEWLYKESHALVIGVSKYDNYPPLPGVDKDIQAVSDALEKGGFKVERLSNPTHDELDKAILSFISKWGEDESSIENSLLIYFAGHGATMGDKPNDLGYIIPRNAALMRDEPAFRSTAISMNRFT